AKSTYPVSFTRLGIHAAQGREAAYAILRESILAWQSLNDINKNVKYTENSRFWLVLLKAIRDLDGLQYKEELVLGPQTFDETDTETYEEMITRIKGFRPDLSRLRSATTIMLIRATR
ncbi:hypothetical protein CEH02_08645, partial [Streptococcus pyogenes]